MTRVHLLPAAGPALLLRALFKRSRPGNAPSAIVTKFRAENLDADRIASYNALLGFAPDALPVTFYYLSAQRAHLATMLRPEFPFRLVGMIHVENAITELARPDVGLPVDLTTSVMVEPATHNGARFCELRTVGEQQGRVVFECRSRYLAVRGKRQKEGQRGEREVAPQTLHELVGEWSLSTSAGRRYAAVSGDWNPIHLWPLSARLFGMKGPIIHGMHTVAKACAKLEQVQGQRLTAIAARFKVPIELGSEVELRRAEVHYQVWCGGKLAVEGTWR